MRKKFATNCLVANQALNAEMINVDPETFKAKRIDIIGDK